MSTYPDKGIEYKDLDMPFDDMIEDLRGALSSAKVRAERAEIDKEDAQGNEASALYRLAQAEAERDVLAEQVVDALGKTSQGMYRMPPGEDGYPLTEDKETAIAAWVDAAHEAAKRGDGEEV